MEWGIVTSKSKREEKKEEKRLNLALKYLYFIWQKEKIRAMLGDYESFQVGAESIVHLKQEEEGDVSELNFIYEETHISFTE